MLYIIATPIGNLEDITLRAIRILKEVDAIAAEDTRHSGILLKRYGIETSMISFHAHSGSLKIEKIMTLLKEGKDVALISDAGTPGISDPGYVLIQEAIQNNIKVSPIPGPSACITALCASGLPADKFLYLGFLPTKKGRQTLFKSLIDEKRTVIFYESPHRIIKTLKELSGTLGSDRKVAICRELTKIYEEIFRGTLESALTHFEKNNPKGEFVVIIGNRLIQSPPSS